MTHEATEVRDPLTYSIIGCAIAVHRELGPGLVESSYEKALVAEFTRKDVSFSRQTAIDLTYAGTPVGKSYRPDFIVAGTVVVEIKSVAVVLPVHRAQILTYMKLSSIELGLLINFNVKYLIHGVERFILTRPT